MFKLVTYDEQQIKDVFAGTEQGVESCDVCGDDMEIHKRLVAVFDLATDDRNARHWLDPRDDMATPYDPSALVNDYVVVGCNRQMRTWRMWARRQEHPADGREFMHFGSEETVRRPFTTHGVPAEVVLTEDPDGQYYGWIACHPERGHAGTPTMIQPHPMMFRIQEPSGFADRVASGWGEIVRMSVRAAA